MSLLQHLIAEAVALGGGNLCASGHEWGFEGGRACPMENEDGVCPHKDCGQAVYRCARCGEYDYGYKGGPGHADCQERGCDPN